MKEWWSTSHEDCFTASDSETSVEKREPVCAQPDSDKPLSFPEEVPEEPEAEDAYVLPNPSTDEQRALDGLLAEFSDPSFSSGSDYVPMTGHLRAEATYENAESQTATSGIPKGGESDYLEPAECCLREGLFMKGHQVTILPALLLHKVFTQVFLQMQQRKVPGILTLHYHLRIVRIITLS